MSTETPLGLIVPVDADPPNGPLQIGGNAERADALHQAGGGTAKRLYTTGEKTRTSTSFGSFSTPYKVTLPKVLANQLLEIYVFGYFKCSIESKVAEAIGAFLTIQVGGATTFEASLAEIDPNGGGKTTAGTWVFAQSKAGRMTGITNPTVESLTNKPGLFSTTAVQPPAPAAFLYLPAAEQTNLTIELVGKSTSGTVTGQNVLVAAVARF